MMRLVADWYTPEQCERWLAEHGANLPKGQRQRYEIVARLGPVDPAEGYPFSQILGRVGSAGALLATGDELTAPNVLELPLRVQSRSAGRPELGFKAAGSIPPAAHPSREGGERNGKVAI